MKGNRKPKVIRYFYVECRYRIVGNNELRDLGREIYEGHNKSIEQKEYADKKHVKEVATIKKAAYKTYKRIKSEVNMNYDDNADINIVDAKFENDLKLKIKFSDGFTRIVDFSRFLNSTDKKYLQKYKDQEQFKKFRIDSGNVVWGKDWDLIFTIKQLYHDNIN